MNADSVSGVLKAAYPAPVETFARAKWMGDAASVCGELCRIYQREESSLIRVIQEEKMVSSLYTLAEVSRPYARVDMPLLKAECPELYARLVHVNAAAAVKAVGVRRFYELMAEELGDAVSGLEVVTATDVRRSLPASVVSRYVIDEEVFFKYAVVEKDE